MRAARGDASTCDLCRLSLICRKGTNPLSMFFLADLPRCSGPCRRPSCQASWRSESREHGRYTANHLDWCAGLTSTTPLAVATSFSPALVARHVKIGEQLPWVGRVLLRHL